MREASRRGFLRGIVALAVATQLPSLPVAEAFELTDSTVEQLMKIRINGGEVKNLKFDDVGNGWLRVSANVNCPMDGMIAMDFEDCNEGEGVFVADEIAASNYLTKLTRVRTVSNLSMDMGGKESTFSVYVRKVPRGQELWGAHLSRSH